MRPPDSTVLSRKALIADDDARARRLCRTVLEEEGYVVREATDAEELLSLAKDHKPDVILVDALLPGKDGPNVARCLRLTSGTDHTAIIMLTELDDALHVMGGLDGDVDDYLAKPIRPKELAARVRAVGPRSRGPGELHRCHTLLGEHARILTLLLDFSAVLAETEHLDRLVDETAMVTASLLSCRRVAIMLPGPDSTSLRIAGAVGIDTRTVADLTVPIGEGVSGRVYESGSRIVVNSVSEADPDEDVYDSRLYSNPPALALPMLASEQTVGVLYLAERVGQHPFTEWELDYLTLLSNCAGSAIQGILTRRAREEAREAITVALASLAEHRDNDTGRHLERMTGFCLILAEKLRTDSNYSKEIDSTFIDDLRRAAPLHDIGKVAIPDHILLKPGKLTANEMEIMRTHAAIGAETIRTARSRSPDSRFLAMAEDIAHGHHEWVDGSGYPRGIRGTGIPRSARIAALADVYDALTTRRVYKDAIPHAQAKSIIVELSDQQFDPVIVEAFLASEDAFHRLVTKLRDPGDADGNAATRVDSPSPSDIAVIDARPTTIAPRDHLPIVLSRNTPTSTTSSRS